MNRVLIVEDSRSIALRLKETIQERLNFEEQLGFEVTITQSYEECEKLLEEGAAFDIALLDLGLPDAPNGEIVELVSDASIPIIILSASEHPSDEVIHNHMVIDYIIKDRSYAIEQAIKMIRRFINNKNYTVLIVDDSKVIAEKLKSICTKYNFNTLVAYSGDEALKLFDTHEIQVVFVDYMLEGMNGLELTSKIRNNYHSDEVCIIAISGSEDQSIVSKFLKYGANDFISKQSSVDEFIARVNNNTNTLELIQFNKDRANKDFLTGMYNRRFLFEKARGIYDACKRQNHHLYVGIVDIDKFKNINDTYGHDIGDVAIKVIAKALEKTFGPDSLVARLGGEEFCIVFANEDEQRARLKFESFRKRIENNKIKLPTCELNYTVSIGYTYTFGTCFDDMVKLADLGLYEAKETGRNKVVFKKA